MALDWRRVFGDDVRPVELPTYAFQRARYWPPAVPEAAPTATPVKERAPVRPVKVKAPPVVRAVSRAGREQLLDLVVGLTSDLLALPAGDIDQDDGFFQLGMDSLLAVELRKELETRLRTELPSTVLFEQPTVAALVDFLSDSSAGTPEPAPADVLPSHVPEPPERAAPDMYGDDLVALLEAEIEHSRSTREGVRTR
ncbi:phosphopantetheine-binding protein [Streptomyces sp. NBC_00433]